MKLEGWDGDKFRGRRSGALGSRSERNNVYTCLTFSKNQLKQKVSNFNHLASNHIYI